MAVKDEKAKKAAPKADAEKSKNLPVKWDEELAKKAKQYSATESSVASSQFFGTRGGILTLNDAPIPGNQVGLIIADSILANVMYETDYDPDNPQAPICWALGRNDKEMAPGEDVAEPCCSNCVDCDNNVFGSADKGRGKACKNIRRLACIVAGSINEKTEQFDAFKNPAEIEDGQMIFLNVPVTSVKPWAAYVKQLEASLNRPPFGVYTRLKVVPDPKTQFKVLFEAIAKVPDSHMAAAFKRNEEAEKLIMFGFQNFSDGDEEDAKREKAPTKTRKAPPKERAGAAKNKKKY